MVSAVNNL